MAQLPPAPAPDSIELSILVTGEISLREGHLQSLLRVEDVIQLYRQQGFGYCLTICAIIPEMVEKYSPDGDDEFHELLL